MPHCRLNERHFENSIFHVHKTAVLSPNKERFWLENGTSIQIQQTYQADLLVLGKVGFASFNNGISVGKTHRATVFSKNFLSIVYYFRTSQQIYKHVSMFHFIFDLYFYSNASTIEMIICVVTLFTSVGATDSLNNFKLDSIS